MLTPVPVTIAGEHVVLEPLAERHAADLFIASQSDEIWLYLMLDKPASEAGVLHWVRDTLMLAAGGSIVPFAIVHRASGRAIGSTRYMEISVADAGLEIGWTWLGRDYWRGAVNTECKYLLMRHAFEQLGAIRLQLKTDLRNTRSQAAIERLGAVREGVLRNHRIVKQGYRRASVVYSVLDTEWPTVKARLEGFLAPTRRSSSPE